MGANVAVEKMTNRSFVLCLILQFWFWIAFNMTLPLIAKYVVAMGASSTMAGFVAGIFSFLALVMRPVAGYIADRVNSKLLLYVGFVATIAAFVIYGTAPNVGWLIVGRVIHAFGLCIQTTVGVAMAMQFIPAGRAVEGVGYIGVAAQIALALGPSVGVFALDLLGYQGTFFAAAAIMLLVMALMAPIHVAPPQRKAGDARLSIRDFVDVHAIPLALTIMSFAICSGLTSSLLVLVGTQRGIAGVTAFFLVSSIGIATLRPFAGRRVDAKGLNAIIPVCFASEITCMSLLAFAGNLPMVVAAAFGRMFGQGIAQSSLQGQVLKDADPEARGVASSTVYIGIDVGQGVGAMVGGALIDIAGTTGCFLLGPTCLVLGIFAYLYWYRRDRRERAAAADGE